MLSSIGPISQVIVVSTLHTLLNVEHLWFRNDLPEKMICKWLLTYWFMCTRWGKLTFTPIVRRLVYVIYVNNCIFQSSILRKQRPSLYFVQTVTLRFDSLVTESCCDIVYVHDGSSTGSTLLARLVGTITGNPVYQTTQPVMFIRFTSDSSVVAQGFIATFSSTKG